MKRCGALLVVCVLLVGACSSGGGSKSGSSGARGADGASHTVWLCRPRLADNPCEADMTTTVVRADGTTSIERAASASNPPIDCFYVYPTVSLQPGPNADLHIDPNEVKVAIAQASRFSQACRVYAPMYRQLTLAAIGGHLSPEATALAYGDVRAAWRDYLTHDNHGRGVVLIGHSQGSGMLIPLVKQELDPHPALRRKLVSALLLGGNVVVPAGRDEGGDFAHVPACRSADQTGCVVAFSSFDLQPPADSLFGRPSNQFNEVRGAGSAEGEVLCVNAAALRGGTAEVHPYFPTHLNLGALGAALPADVLASTPTPWVTYPGLFKAACREADGASWLQIDDVRGPGDTRPHLIDSLGPMWGLHLVDVNIALGDLVSLVRQQGAAWSRHH